STKLGADLLIPDLFRSVQPKIWAIAGHLGGEKCFQLLIRTDQNTWTQPYIAAASGEGQTSVSTFHFHTLCVFARTGRAHARTATSSHHNVPHTFPYVSAHYHHITSFLSRAITSSSLSNFAKLNASNYPSWCGEMQAWLCAQGVWSIVSSQSKAPKQFSPPKDTEEAALDAWNTKSDKAAGYIYVSGFF
ncbi:hypothetical protein CVT25_012044, partial [Psilocybe cyanescens]